MARSPTILKRSNIKALQTLSIFYWFFRLLFYLYKDRDNNIRRSFLRKMWIQNAFFVVFVAVQVLGRLIILYAEA